jgi:sporulation-control protein spo0M
MEGNMEIEETILIEKLAKVQADIELAVEENNKDIIFESNHSIMSNVFLELGTPINKDHWNTLVELHKEQKRKQ